MQNCADQYADRLSRDKCRLFSIRRRGVRVATLEIGPHPREAGVLAISQLKARHNMPAASRDLAGRPCLARDPEGFEAASRARAARPRGSIAGAWENLMSRLPRQEARRAVDAAYRLRTRRSRSSRRISPISRAAAGSRPGSLPERDMVAFGQRPLSPSALVVPRPLSGQPQPQ